MRQPSSFAGSTTSTSRVLGRKVDVVGMDACLMTMIEVAYEMRDYALVLVGSEKTEPGPGWPHAAILGVLTARPALKKLLGCASVAALARSYVGVPPEWPPARDV
jgi:Clostripain family